MDERETQFHAALLVCGSVPKLKVALEFQYKGASERFDYDKFKAHKITLIAHLREADYFDVVYSVPGSRNDPLVHEVLTEKAALWIGEFYKWLLSQQQLHTV